MNLKSLLTRLSLSGFVAILIVSVLFVVSAVRLANTLSADYTEREMVSLAHQFDNLIESLLEQNALAITTIAQIPAVQKAVAEGDKATLSALFDRQWPDIKAAGVKQFQFHKPPATSLYRVHKPEKSGDDLASFRQTVVDVNRNQKAVAGLEAGVAGLGLRYVAPVSYEGLHVGSVEFGMALNRATFAEMLEDKTLDMAVYLDKQQALTPLIEPAHSGLEMLTPSEYAEVLSGGVVMRKLKYQNTHLVVRAIPLEDYSGKVIGVVEIIKDTSHLAGAIWSGIYSLVVIGIISAVLAFAGLFWLTRVSVAPIHKLVKAMRGTVEGSSGLSSRLEQSGPQEVEQLTEAFNQFCQKLQVTFSAVSDTVAHISSQSNSLSGESAAADAGMRRQQDEIAQIATAMTEMTATVHDVAANIAAVADAAIETNDKARQGRAVVDRAINTMTSLADSIQQTGGLIEEVNAASGSIASILEVIQGISEQTNLLALNAAIEAARAGDQGRGFAVVANEVRMLAQRTQESTEEIRNKIANLEQSVGSTVTTIRASQQQAQDSVTSIRSAGDALKEISLAIEQISDMNAQIATASEQQSNVSDEINANVVSINDFSKETATASLHTAELAELIAVDVEKLTESVAAFASDDSSGEIQELVQAKTAHFSWKTRVRGFLSGRTPMSENEVVSHQDCKLGRWYYGGGQQRYAHLPAIKQIEKPHEQLHKTIAEIIKAKQQGEHERAAFLLKQLDECSDQVVGHLDTLLAELRAEELA